MPPTRADTPLIRLSISLDAGAINTRMNRGMIFCQVLRIRHESQLRLAITLGNQKCSGAAPIFSSRARITIAGVKGRFVVICVISRPNRRRADPVAWAIKYLIAPSVSWWFEDEVINGMKDSRFNSSAIHTNNQWEEERATSVLVNSVVENTVMGGRVEFINLRKELNLS